jgi:hypothetical protein
MLRARTLPSLALLALLGAATSLLRQRAQALQPQRPELQLDIPAFPVEVSRPFSFGLRSLVADLTFLEAIQVHGARKTSVASTEGRAEDRILARLLQYTVDLDPKFRGAYRFAASALPRHTTDGYAPGVFAAEQILRKGVVERADDWQIAFLLGFLESFYLGKMQAAGDAMAQAATLPGAPRYVGLLATRLNAEAGDTRTAEQLAAVMEAQATEEATKQEWHERTLDLRVERQLRQIEAAAARYKSRTGAAAKNLEALVAAHELPELPREPRGGHYVLQPDGEAHSTATPRLRVRGRAGTQSGLIAQ